MHMAAAIPAPMPVWDTVTGSRRVHDLQGGIGRESRRAPRDAADGRYFANPSRWYYGHSRVPAAGVRHLEGRAVSHRSIRA
jgi:hypothetical protein